MTEEVQDAESSTTPRPRVSVVIEGYNESRDLGEAANTIAALEAQRGFPLDQVEVILVANGEQNESWEALTVDSPFFDIRVVDGGNARYFELKNLGASHARGEIIALTDSDVTPRPQWLASLVHGIDQGADMVMGLSLFKSSGGWNWNLATRLAAASITWGWVIGKGTPAGPAGFMDHNVAFRAETFRDFSYRTEFGRILGAPLLYRTLYDAGAKLRLEPQQQVIHYFDWFYWLSKLHFRYGYEVYMLRRLDDDYPNQWIRRTSVLEPPVTMAWHVLLDVPRWFRFGRLQPVSRVRRVLLFPLLLAMSTLARATEMLGMYCTMVAPERMRRWAESV